ncbi:MAG: hypothetical protein JO363_23320, partial [Solirubrobacterales bacterium]|nr:hypothetical protein [Solirubrobacterales bacterium]
GLVSGTNADTFAPAGGGYAGTARAGNVPAQVVNLYQAAINDDQPSAIFPSTDPADLVASLVDRRASGLAGALNAHIVSTGAQPAALNGHVQLSAALAAPQTTSAVFAEENPYIGPTLDRLDETAFVLNNQASAATTTTGTPPAPAPPSPPAVVTPPFSAGKTAAKCALRSVSGKVLLAAPRGKPKKGAPAAKPGTLSLTIKCNQSGKVKLTGKLTQLIGTRPKHGKQKTKTYPLGPVNASVRAGRVVTLVVKLPAAAVTALGNGARQSASFTAVLTGATGTGRATIEIALLRATR